MNFIPQNLDEIFPVKDVFEFTAKKGFNTSFSLKLNSQ